MSNIYELLLKSKDETILIRVPEIMKTKLAIDAKKLGIDSSKLTRYILATFLQLDSEGQVNYLKSMGSGESNKKPARKKRSKKYGPESEDRERE